MRYELTSGTGAQTLQGGVATSPARESCSSYSYRIPNHQSSIVNIEMLNGFHQAIVSAMVFLAGTTLSYLKVFVVDGPEEHGCLRRDERALRIRRDDRASSHAAPSLVDRQRRSSTVRENSAPANVEHRLLLGNGVSLVVAQWSRPLPGLTHWINT